VDAADYEARGLYDPSAPNAADRLSLLNWLTELGIPIDQIIDAHERDHLPALAGDLALRPGRRFTLGDVAESSGLTVDQIRQLTLTIGRPVTEADERAFSEADVEAFRMFGAGALFFGERALMQFTRVLGSSLGRIADAAVSLFLADVESPLAEANAGELALAKANYEAVTSLNALRPVMESAFRGLMEEAIERNRAARTETSSMLTVFVAVGFIDLVGFTPLSQSLPVPELTSLIDQFEGTAYDVVASHGGRVVKLIGDEVMFVALDAASAGEIALALVDRFALEASVTPRGGLAVGEILTRGGDYYGPVVNVASRIADLAVPNEILVTDELRERAEKSAAPLAFDAAGRRQLKGFDEPMELFALRRP